MSAVWLTGLGAAALLAGLAIYLAPLEPGILALQLAFTPQAFARIIHVWPPDHLARYRAHLPVDGLLLLAYGAFGFLLSTRTALFSASRAGLGRLAAWTLPFAAAFDALENISHAWLTAAPRLGVPLAYAVSASASAAKWTLLLVFGGLVIHGLLARVKA
ncbi:MAG: hypothetical protein ABS84_17760 [Rubrivivax sp. SCN 71-131]|jgi:hypothetical protein|nr:MAG: hypothetical protein ABS84_17760 [Rubrivivax sp. SCN 71-131]